VQTVLKRMFVPALLLGFGSSLALSGCGDESKMESTTKVETPTGTDTKSVTVKEKTTGDAGTGTGVKTPPENPPK
jgi:hypothetical protein